jgi:uncharacterized protein YecE (DUF72 family)
MTGRYDEEPEAPGEIRKESRHQLTGAEPRHRHGRATFRVGTSGYHYRHWRGIFYPESLPPEAWFGCYAVRFDTVELNNTFYRLPRARTFAAWRDAAPPGFSFAVKFSRYGSHLKRLKTPRSTLRRFLTRAERLGASLGPILVQLPPDFRPRPERLAAFLDAAPRRRRWAVEFRDRRWLCNEVFAVLRAHGAALCVHDMIEDHPRVVTASWVYLRFHGNRYAGSYSTQHLTARAREIRAYLADGLDVYAYFNNDVGGHAVRNALDLRRYVDRA